MNAKQMILDSIVTVRQSNWRWPALMTLALVVTVLGVSGCQPHH